MVVKLIYFFTTDLNTHLFEIKIKVGNKWIKKNSRVNIMSWKNITGAIHDFEKHWSVIKIYTHFFFWFFGEHSTVNWLKMREMIEIW